MTRAVCRVHPEAPAVASCHVCFTQLCEVCRVLDGMLPHCAQCLRKVRRAPLVRGALLVVAVAAGGAGIYWIVKNGGPGPEPDLHSLEVTKLEAALAKEPCDRPKMLSLLEQMLATGDNRGVLGRAAAFTAKCGNESKLKERTFQAHKRLGELDLAVGDLTALVESSPANPYYRAWRGGIYEEQGNLDRAIEDLEKALVLYPAATDIPLNLATLYEKQGKFCQATVPLEAVVFRYADEPFVTSVRARLTALDERGACTTSGAARVTIRASRGGMFVTKGRLCDAENATLLVDTGASYVTLSRKIADRLHLDLDHAPRKEIRTANGKKDGAFVVLSSLAIEKLSSERVPAVVLDDLGPGIDALLGQSFLSHFDVKQGRDALEIATRDHPSP